MAATPPASDSVQPPRVGANDNRVPAGTLREGVLTLRLELSRGDWYPETEPGPHIIVDAFAEEGKPPTIPGPMIRVLPGTRIKLHIRNSLSVPRVLHGLNQRPGKDDPVTLEPGESRDLEFNAGEPGTYFYWAAAPGDVLEGLTGHADPVTSQLTGAFVVDDPERPQSDRVFILGVWSKVEKGNDARPFSLFGVINGKAWPYDERLHYRVGEIVHMRWINASEALHPMHMHGAFYRVDAMSDGQREEVLQPEQRPMVVTQLLVSGASMEMTWKPSRPGKWLFHCHLLAHVVESGRAPFGSLSLVQHPENLDQKHGAKMTGLTMAFEVTGKSATPRPSYRHARKLNLVIEERQSSPLEVHTRLREGARSSESEALMGPPIVLRRGESVTIAVENRMHEETAIHWHGMELESYYDGVPEFSGEGRQVTPPISPGKTFQARFTPPRPGTFIYHTHWHDVGQLIGGLYGPLIVLEDKAYYDPDNDMAFVAGGNADLLINGRTQLPPMSWQAGKTYHVRLINIMVNTPVVFSLRAGQTLSRWTAVGKDGMTLPTAQRLTTEAKLRIATGETYDFEITPASGDLVLRALRPANPAVRLKEYSIEVPIRVHRLGSADAPP